MNITLDRQVLEAAPQAMAQVGEQIFGRFPNLEQTFGPDARTRCGEDLAFHLEYLAAAVGMGDSAPFIDYLKWVASVLDARNVRLDCLKVSLELLADFFSGNASPGSSEARLILLAGLDALDELARVSASIIVPAPTSIRTARLSQALLAGDRKGAWGVVEEAGSSCHLAELGAKLIQPTLYEIGALWQANRVTVAQEHLATAITQYLLVQAFTLASFSPSNGRKAMFANVETNHHSLGLRIISDVFETSGWEVQFLGANVPTDALVRQVADWRPELVGLSLSLPQHFAHARGVIAALRAELGSATPALLLGGLVVNQFPKAVSRLGADLVVSDALAAEKLALSP
jgi:methanogenic corrinoid protein MtbC1